MSTYLDSIDILGESARPGLRSQVIVAKINGIDEEKLRRAVAGDSRWRSAITDGALSLASRAPKAVLDLALPIAGQVLKSEYGIDATLSAANAPPPVRSASELWPGVALGLGLAGAGWGLLHFIRWARR